MDSGDNRTPGQKLMADRYLWEQMTALREEMARTREAMRRYNDLRETQNRLMDRVAQLERHKFGNEGHREGREDLREDWIRWGGWLFGLFGLLIAAATLYDRVWG